MGYLLYGRFDILPGPQGMCRARDQALNRDVVLHWWEPARADFEDACRRLQHCGEALDKNAGAEVFSDERLLYLIAPATDAATAALAQLRQAGLFTDAQPAPAAVPNRINRSELLHCMDEWNKLAPAIPAEILTQSARLGSSVPAAELTKIAEIVAKAAVRYTDEMIDVIGKNARFEEALRKLVHAAGLSLIEPMPRDAYNDARHLVAATNCNAPSRQLRGRIARVTLRGLERSGRVVAKAAVILYD